MFKHPVPIEFWTRSVCNHSTITPLSQSSYLLAQIDLPLKLFKINELLKMIDCSFYSKWFIKLLKTIELFWLFKMVELFYLIELSYLFKINLKSFKLFKMIELFKMNESIKISLKFNQTINYRHQDIIYNLLVLLINAKYRIDINCRTAGSKFMHEF